MNNIRILLRITALCLFSSCCNPKTTNKTGDDVLYVINVDQAKTKEYTLSEFIDSIEYVYLTEPMTGPVMKYDISNHFAVFYDGLDRILLYRRDGQFIKQVGHKGNGPGEYARIIDLVLDEQNDAIHALCRAGFIYQYNLLGEFISRTQVEQDTDLLALVSSGITLTHVANWEGNKENRFLIRNALGEVLISYPNPFVYSLMNKRNRWKNEAIKYTYNDQLHVKDKSDTLYLALLKKIY